VVAQVFIFRIIKHDNHLLFPGLVGGWIVEHLLMRGEDPAAIRVLDLNEPETRKLLESGGSFVKTDVTNKESIARAFEQAWPNHVRTLPLTVFHTVAYINPSDRNAAFLLPYVSVNIEGTRNILNAAQKAGADCFVATSSASVGLRIPSYFPWPWQRWPKDIYQFLPNADPTSPDLPLGSYGTCYAWSKAQAEKLVRLANNDEFRTGVIRPGHGIYGHGVENPNSLTWQYLSRGGSPTWLYNVVAHFVSAENVSIGHLAFEDALLKKDSRVGGNAYCVLDPNPPIIYADLYRALLILAHPATPIKFPKVPHIVMLFMAYGLEQYHLLRNKFLPSLPALSKDLTFLQPAVFNVSALHIVYTDTAAQNDIGYRAPISTLEGFALAMREWNEKVEAKAKSKSDAVSDMHEDRVVPQPPMIR